MSHHLSLTPKKNIAKLFFFFKYVVVEKSEQNAAVGADEVSSNALSSNRTLIDVTSHQIKVSCC